MELAINKKSDVKSEEIRKINSQNVQDDYPEIIFDEILQTFSKAT